MCGRTTLYTPRSELESRFDAHFVRDDYEPRYNIAPGDDLAVITNDAAEEIDLFRWGLVPHWVDDPDDWSKPINARAETVREKSSFSGAFESRRCLVLSDGFYEWKGERGSKQPYRVALEDNEPFAFAGLWERWGSNGDALTTCTIITTEANDIVEPVHDRMPVILDSDEERDWLAVNDEEELQSFLNPYGGDDLVTYPITKRVNDPAFDDPEVLVEAEDVGEQSGLEEFV